MNTLTKEELTTKWENERKELLSKLNFMCDHKFDHEADYLRDKIHLYDKFISDIRFELK